MDIYKAFEESVNRWAKKGFDNRIEKASDKFEGWIQNYDEEEKQIISKLIEKFDYYSRNNIIEIVKELCDLSIKELNLTNDNSVVSVIRKPSGIFNSSYEYWMLHEVLSGMSKKIYYDSLDSIDDEDWENISNVMFIDDCSGTGEQFVKFLKMQKKAFLGKRICLLVVEIMEEAQSAIKKYADEAEIDIVIIAHKVKEKALKKSDIVIRDKFIDMSKRQKISDASILGFKEAEALMAFYNNTPNDTLGIFWFSSVKNVPIFKREKVAEPGWKKIKKDKKERRRQQYEAKSSRS